MIKNILCIIMVCISFYFALGQEMDFFPIWCLGMVAAYLIWR